MKCSRCGHEKEPIDFYRDKTRKNGRCSICKQCKNAYDRRTRQTRKEQVNRKNREYSKTGGTRRFFASRMVQGSRSRSKLHKRSCTITTENVLALFETQGNRCKYLRVPMIWRPWSGIYRVSIDRIDSGSGYSFENCQLVCAGINRLKTDLTNETFQQLLHFLAKYPQVESPFMPYDTLSTVQKSKFNHLFRDIRYRSRGNSTLTHDGLCRLREKYQDRCALSGIPVSWECKQFNTASWDRIDSAGDYTPDNIQLTIWPINRMKQSETNEETMKMIKAIRLLYQTNAQ